MFRVKIYRDSPFEGCSGYTKILKSRKKEVIHHLVLTRFRLNKFRMCIDIVNETVCVFAHFEEICFFLCRYTWTSTVRTLTIYQLRFCKERFTWGTVHSFVMSLVDISLCIHFLKNLLDLFFMVFICGTNEFVIRSIHQIPDSLDLTGNIVNKFLWCDSCFLCFQLDLLTMLVCSCLEKHVITLLSLITCNSISKNNLVSIADMRFTGSIGNGCCNIIFLFIHFISSLKKIKKTPSKARMYLLVL